MSGYAGRPARPDLNHFLSPMWVPVDPTVHVCRRCYPDFYARLAPGFSTCIRCGAVIVLENQDAVESEEDDDVCEECWAAMEVELSE